MQNSPSWSDLHDATLLRVECRWEDGCFYVYLRTGISACPEVQIVATGGRRLDCPRMHPWGPSVSVNEVRGPTELAEKLQRLEIEMQSGDVIVLDAEEFRIVAP
jgi:hypothetical protein